MEPVSYTHLDVYKRQVSVCVFRVSLRISIVFSASFTDMPSPYLLSASAAMPFNKLRIFYIWLGKLQLQTTL